MKPVIIFGAGQFAEVAHFYFTRDAGRKIAAFTVDGEEKDASGAVFGTPVVPWEEAQKRFPPAQYDAFVAIGSSRVNRSRKEKCAQLKALGYNLASYVSSKAILWTDQIGEHAFILEHNTIQPYSRIGHNVIVWSGNHIGHHVTVGDHCFITSHVVISGGATIGEGSFLGVNATLRDHIRIGRHNVIGAGAVMLKDTGDDEVYASAATPRHALKSDQLSHI